VVSTKYPTGSRNFLSMVSDVIIYDVAGAGPGSPSVPTFIHTVRFDGTRRIPGTAPALPPYVSAGDGLAAEPVPAGFTAEVNDIRVLVAPTATSFATSTVFDPFDNSRFDVYMNGSLLAGWSNMPVTSVIHFGKDFGAGADFFPWRSHVESSPKLSPETIVLGSGLTMDVRVKNEGSTAQTKSMYVNIIVGGVLLPGTARRSLIIKSW